METYIKNINHHTYLIYSDVYKKLCVKKSIDTLSKPYFEELKQMEVPYLAKVLEVTNDYILTEYIEGTSLVEYFVLYPQVNGNMLISLIHNICSALLVLHSQHLIHRDIKPQNIIIKENGEAYLIDFETVRMVKENKLYDTELLGTRGYASPEHYGFQETDERSDIYSLGMVLQYCVEQMQLNHPFFNRIIEKCIKVDPNARYQNVLEILKELEASQSITPQQSTSKKRSLKLPIYDKVLYIIAVVVFALIGILYSFAWFSIDPRNATVTSLFWSKIGLFFFLFILDLIPIFLFLLIAYIVIKILKKQTSLLKGILIILIAGIISFFLMVISIVIAMF